VERASGAQQCFDYPRVFAGGAMELIKLCYGLSGFAELEPVFRALHSECGRKRKRGGRAWELRVLRCTWTWLRSGGAGRVPPAMGAGGFRCCGSSMIAAPARVSRGREEAQAGEPAHGHDELEGRGTRVFWE
jgi:hypothetical protein